MRPRQGTDHQLTDQEDFEGSRLQTLSASLSRTNRAREQCFRDN
jgi:hypothetical protein